MKTKHLIAVPLAVAVSMGVAPAAQADTLGDLDVVAEVEIGELMKLAMKAKVKGPQE